MNDVWGTGTPEAYAVGIRGTIFRSDGANWTDMGHSIEMTIDLTHVSGFGRDASSC